MSVTADLMPMLQERHMEGLTFQEVRRAAQAVSRTYVQGRSDINQAAWGRGKQAAFGVYYAPLHGLAVEAVLSELGPGQPRRIVDVGCGTGLPGLIWRALCKRPPELLGIEPSTWAAREAAWLYRASNVRGKVQRAGCDALRTRAGDAVLLAYVVNELDADTREALLGRLVAARARGVKVLIIEPIARITRDWWDPWKEALEATDGELSVQADRPEFIREMDRATKLDHQRLKARWMRA